ncbi:MAG TPA: glycosyltransferase family 87 protein [Aggregatilineales bacterium]|nr:glycosyltransferase family 87 protein [Aggregatilineales bacterium]
MTTTLPAWKRMALLAVLGVVLLGAYTWAFHEFIVTGPVDAIAMDFYARYEPTRLYLTEGLNPYSDEATQIVHRGIYGDDHVKLEPQHAFFYPMYTMLIIAPYTLLPAFSWAQAAWQVTLQVLLIASLLLTLDFLNWRPRLQVIILLGLWTFVLFPVTHSLVLGQFSVVTFFLTVLAIWLLFHGEPSARRDVLAGVCLALSTIKPQMQFLIIPLLVLWALKARRWHFIASAALTLGALLGVSFLLMPTWLGDWFAQMQTYSSFALTQPPVLQLLTHEFIRLGDGALWALRVLLAGWLLVEWWLLLRGDDERRLGWVLALTLVITHLLAPRTGTYQYAVFLFALLPVLQRLEAAHPLAMLGAMVVLFVGDWWLMLATRTGTEISSITLIPLPLVTLVLLALVRGSAGRVSPERITSVPHLKA